MAAITGVNNVWFFPNKKKHDKDESTEVQRKVDIYKSRLDKDSKEAVNSIRKANDSWERLDKNDRALMVFLATGGDRRK